MVGFFFLCLGFSIATAIVSAAHVVAFAWHGAKQRAKTGASSNLKGRALAELIIGWIALGVSITTILVLLPMYPS